MLKGSEIIILTERDARAILELYKYATRNGLADHRALHEMGILEELHELNRGCMEVLGIIEVGSSD